MSQCLEELNPFVSGSKETLVEIRLDLDEDVKAVEIAHPKKGVLSNLVLVVCFSTKVRIHAVV